MHDTRAGIIRAERPSDRFAQISNDTLADKRLSYRARGVLAYLLSRPVGWTTSREAIARQGTEGRDAIGTALRELEAVGYVRRVRTQDAGGRWSTATYVFDSPVIPQVAPETDFQSSVNQASVDQASVDQAVKTKKDDKKDSTHVVTHRHRPGRVDPDLGW